MNLLTSSFLRPGRLAGAGLLAAFLTACGGGSNSTPPVDPLATFKQQKLDWQACDPTLMGEGENPITALGDRARCAQMRAPLDYANPALGELQVALLRVSAEQAPQRVGAILFNPGGPGGDGLVMAALFGQLWTSADPADPTGKLLKDMAAQYDMVGFSPRGVGASSTLTCASSELLEIVNNLSFDRSPQNMKNAQHNALLRAKACGKNPLTKHIHTEATARDMDLMRELLGDAKLNFIGYSYGTWLGSWYASLFPERVGRMLLDSSMNVTGSLDDATLLQEMGKQRVLDKILIPYAARHPDGFNLGRNASEVSHALTSLPPSMKQALVPAIDFGRALHIDDNVLNITAAVGLEVLRKQMPQATIGDVRAAIQTYPFTIGPYNTDAAEFADQLADTLFRPLIRQNNLMLPSDAVYRSVVCNDMATIGDEQHWVDIGNDYAARYPFTGGQASANPCLYWSAPVTTRPSIAQLAKAGPLLMVQSRYDALTPIEGAQATLDALPAASMIVIEDEYTHGLFPYSESCVDTKVAAYFVSGAMPPRTSTCAGHPLPADASAASANRTRKAEPASGSAYKDPAQAARITRRIHQQIGEASRGR